MPEDVEACNISRIYLKTIVVTLEVAWSCAVAVDAVGACSLSQC